MRRFVFSVVIGLATALGGGAALAASAEQEQAFIDAYSAAFAAEDAAALTSLLFSNGAIPMAVEFYTTQMTAEFGKPLTSITLQELSAEDLAEIELVMPMPDGTNARLEPKPYKKLVVKIDTSDSSGTSSTTSSAFVAEKDGRLGIAMPVAAN